MNKVENAVWAMAEPIALQNGLELIEVEFVKEGNEWYLRLFLDKETAPWNWMTVKKSAA